MLYNILHKGSKVCLREMMTQGEILFYEKYSKHCPQDFHLILCRRLITIDNSNITCSSISDYKIVSKEE